MIKLNKLDKLSIEMYAIIIDKNKFLLKSPKIVLLYSLGDYML